MNDRPGVMCYFSDWSPLLQLDDTSLAKLFRAAIEYAQAGVVPEFEGIEAVLWGMIFPKLDRDGERYQIRKDSGAYAAYCREEKRAGRDPACFDEWKIERERSLSTDNENIQMQMQQQQHRQYKQQQHIHSQSQLQGKGQAQGDCKGAQPYVPLSDADFENRRAERLRTLEIYD